MTDAQQALDAYLDFCAAFLATLRSRNRDQILIAHHDLSEGAHNRLWNACLAAGLTPNAINAAYAARFLGGEE